MMEVSGHKFLSAEDLLVEVSTKKQQRVPVVGAKFSSHSPPAQLVSADLERFYADRRRLLSEEKVEKTSRIGEGIWLSEAGVVQLTRPLGRAFQRFGHVLNGAEVLYPEEALFLMESRHLIVSYHGLPLSVQDAYKSLLKTEQEIDTYHVYSHLRRLGFVVLRHCCDAVEADDRSQAISDNGEASGVEGSKDHDDGHRLLNATGVSERVTGSCIASLAGSNIDQSPPVASRAIAVDAGVDTLLGAGGLDDGGNRIAGSACSELQSVATPTADSCLLPGAACSDPVTDRRQGDTAAACVHTAAATEVAVLAAVDDSDLYPPTKRLRASAESELLDEKHFLSTTVAAAAGQGGVSCSCSGDAGALSAPAQQLRLNLSSASPSAAADGNDRACERSGDGTAAAAELSAPYYRCTDFGGSPATLKPTSAICWDFTSVVLPDACGCGSLKVTDDVKGSSPGEHVGIAQPELSPEVSRILSEYLPAVGDAVSASYDTSELDIDEQHIYELPSWWPLRQSVATWHELKAAAAASRLPRDEHPPYTATTSSSGDALDDVLHSAFDIEPLAGPADAVCHSMLLNKLDIIRSLPGLPGTHS